MTLHHRQERFTALTAGAVAVGTLTTMDPAGALAVLLFRDWRDGPIGRERAGAVIAEALDARAARDAIGAWDALLDELDRHARRPLAAHGIGCACVGADEAIVAQALSLAARGEREDAMLIFSLIMRADRLPCVMAAAETAGRAVMRCAVAMCRCRPAGTALH